MTPYTFGHTYKYVYSLVWYARYLYIYYIFSTEACTLLAQRIFLMNLDDNKAFDTLNGCARIAVPNTLYHFSCISRAAICVNNAHLNYEPGYEFVVGLQTRWFAAGVLLSSSCDRRRRRDRFENLQRQYIITFKVLCCVSPFEWVSVCVTCQWLWQLYTICDKDYLCVRVCRKSKRAFCVCVYIYVQVSGTSCRVFRWILNDSHFLRSGWRYTQVLNDYDYTNQTRFGSTNKLSSPANYHPRSVHKVSVNREALFSECKTWFPKKKLTVSKKYRLEIDLKSFTRKITLFEKKTTHTHKLQLIRFLLRYSVRYHRCWRHSRPPEVISGHTCKSGARARSR